MPKLKIDRRAMLQILAGGGAMTLGGLGAGRALAQGAERSKLYILGTRAGPVVGADRNQTAHALVIGDSIYMIDCGYGATEQLARAGLPLAGVRDIFITHHHPDHSIELGTLIYFAWYAGMPGPTGVYGPPPLETITGHYLQAIKPAVDVWLDDIGHAPMGPVTPHNVSAAGLVMEDENIRVTCSLANHPPVTPALSYRFDTPDRSIVFSGDTTPMDSLVELAMGADVLVHEAIIPEGLRRNAQGGDNGRTTDEGGSAIAGDADKVLEHVINSHTTAAEAGEIAQRAGVKTLVLSHTVPMDDTYNVGRWTEEARTHFTGQVIIAQDLMVI